jgi:hypothetical protein
LVINVRRFIGGYVAGSRRVRLERCDGGEVFALAAVGGMETLKRSGLSPSVG